VYFEGLTQSEVAKRTGVPLGTVKTRVRTALASLKVLLLKSARRPTSSFKGSNRPAAPIRPRSTGPMTLI
jgi:Sigma-70, region 4